MKRILVMLAGVLLLSSPAHAAADVAAIRALLAGGAYREALTAIEAAMPGCQPAPAGERCLSLAILRARALGRLGKGAAAVPAATAAVDAARARGGRMFAEALVAKAEAFGADGRHGETIEPLRQAIAILGKDRSRDAWLLGSALGSLGSGLANEGRYAEAAAALKQGEPPLVAAGAAAQPELAELYTNQAAVENGLGRFDRAVSGMARAMAICTKPQFLRHVSCGTIRTGRARIVLNTGRPGSPAEAETEARAGLALLEPMGDEYPPLFMARIVLAQTLDMQGRFGEAEVILLDALRKTKALGRSESQAQVIFAAAQHMLILTRYEPAEKLIRTALAMGIEKTGPKSPFVRSMRNDLAGCLIEMGRPAEAITMLREDIEAARRVTGRDTLAIAVASASLAQALNRVGQNAEAAILYRDAVRIMAAEGDPMRFDTLMIEMRYGDFLSRTPATQAGARNVLRAANRRALQRAAAYPIFGPLQNSEMKAYAPFFRREIAVAWGMSQGR